MARKAAGITRSGLGASPEVTAITSMPTNDSTPRMTAIHSPSSP